MKNTVACVHAHISRRRNRLLVRLSCAGRVLWRSYPLDMPEDEAVMLAVKRLFPSKPSDEAHDGQVHDDVEVNLNHSPPPLRVARWTRLQDKV